MLSEKNYQAIKDAVDKVMQEASPEEIQAMIFVPYLDLIQKRTV